MLKDATFRVTGPSCIAVEMERLTKSRRKRRGKAQSLSEIAANFACLAERPMRRI